MQILDTIQNSTLFLDDDGNYNALVYCEYDEVPTRLFPVELGPWMDYNTYKSFCDTIDSF